MKLARPAASVGSIFTTTSAFRDRFFRLSEIGVTQSKINMRHDIRGIRLRPQLIGLNGVFKLPGDNHVVQAFNGKFLAFADTIAQIECFLDILSASELSPILL